MGEIDHPFQRLQTTLAELISATPPGERLESEPELAKKLAVSRATLREAMRTFEGQGLIRRRQGVGTFVVGHGPVFESGLETLTSLETMAKQMKLDVTMGDLHVSQINADAEYASILKVNEGAALIQVTRVIQTNERPVAYLIDILPEDVLRADDLESGFTGSVLDLLLQRGDPPLASSRTEIRSIAATAEIARALEIQRGDVLLLFVAYLHTTSGRVVDYSYSYFLPGYFRFHIVRNVGPAYNLSRAAVEQERKKTGQV